MGYAAVEEETWTAFMTLVETGPLDTVHLLSDHKKSHEPILLSQPSLHGPKALSGHHRDPIRLRHRPCVPWVQPLWCKYDSAVLWAWDSGSSHNSQHLLDPYSVTHFQHGIVLFVVLLPVLRSRPGLQLNIVILIEAAWEILENTPVMIERYRKVTVSLDYYGDSAANSISDLFMCWMGFDVVRRLPW